MCFNIRETLKMYKKYNYLLKWDLSPLRSALYKTHIKCKQMTHRFPVKDTAPLCSSIILPKVIGRAGIHA